MVPFSIREPGRKLCHPLAAIWAFRLLELVDLYLVEVKDAAIAEDVAAVCLHGQTSSFVADRAFPSI